MLKLSTRDAWAAGAQLMADADPARWIAAQQGYRLVESADNLAVLGACMATAQQTRKDQRCAIVVPEERAEFCAR